MEIRKSDGPAEVIYTPTDEERKVRCPQCQGHDRHCQYCDGMGVVPFLSAIEWHRQND